MKEEIWNISAYYKISERENNYELIQLYNDSFLLLLFGY